MLGWELPPHNSGGLGVACLQMCKELARQGADIMFILPYKADYSSIDFMKVLSASPKSVLDVYQHVKAYDSNKYVHKNGRVEWFDMFGQQYNYEEAVEKLAEKLEFDVIHAHDWLTFRGALRAKEVSGKPLILHVHSIERDRAGGKQGNPMVREIEYTSMMLADRIVAISEHTKRMICEDYNIPADKVEVVHNSIDLGEMEPLDSDNSYRYLTKLRANGYRVVVNVGRLTIQKGLPNLLRAMQNVVFRAPKTLLLIVGSGELEHELLELAAILGISRNVIFTGFQRGKKWRDAYGASDLFVLPSISEPFGLTPLEAIGYGTPTLISKQSGVAEVLLNTLRVDFWDIEEMANQITAVVQNDALRDELQKNAYQEYLGMSWESSVKKLFNIYETHIQGAMA